MLLSATPAYGADDRFARWMMAGLALLSVAATALTILHPSVREGVHELLEALLAFGSLQ